MELIRVAEYQRRVHAGPERVWENVRDWEHLPWLHAASFDAIELLDEGAWGWKARIGLQPVGHPAVIELCIDSERSRYVARTLEGELRGAEVWTTLRSEGPEATDVEVEFWIPRHGAPQRDAIAAGYLALYQRLWDEDEAMMVHRAAELRALREAPRVARGSALQPLGREPEVRARAPFCVTWDGRPFRIVELDGALLAHATRCPHRLGPLGEARVEAGCVVCPWHGYRFDLRSGTSTDGRSLRLDRPPAITRDASGMLWLGPPPVPAAARGRVGA